MKILCLYFFLTLLSACGVVTESGVYEGVRQQQELRRDTTVPDPDKLPSFDKFKDERDKLKPPVPHE